MVNKTNKELQREQQTNQGNVENDVKDSTPPYVLKNVREPNDKEILKLNQHACFEYKGLEIRGQIFYYTTGYVAEPDFPDLPYAEFKGKCVTKGWEGIEATGWPIDLYTLNEVSLYSPTTKRSAVLDGQSLGKIKKKLHI